MSMRSRSVLWMSILVLSAAACSDDERKKKTLAREAVGRMAAEELLKQQRSTQDPNKEQGAQDPSTEQQAGQDPNKEQAGQDPNKEQATQDPKSKKGAQDPTSKKSQADRIRAMAKMAEKLFAKNKIEIDRKNQTVTVPVVVNAPTDNIEYLLIHRSGKTHEGILITFAAPSVLNAALMSLGLKQGKNVILKDKKPMPSEAELRKGVSPYNEIPPEGDQIWITVTMDLKGGKKKTMAVEDLIYDIRNDHPVTDTRWVYLGGRIAVLYRGEPPVFMADMEGNLVSTIYMGAGDPSKGEANHLVTMVHEHAGDQENWWISRACPPPNTKGKLTFHRKKPKVVVEREKRIAEIRKQKAKSQPDPSKRRVPPREVKSQPTSRKSGKDE